MTPDEWSVTYARRADRDLARLDPQVRARVFAAIDDFVADPRPDRLSKLTGRPESRLRVGDWRVLCVPDLERRHSTSGASSPAAGPTIADPVAWLRGVAQEVVHDPGGSPQAWDDVAVGAAQQRGAGMPEHIGHFPHRHAGGQQQ